MLSPPRGRSGAAVLARGRKLATGSRREAGGPAGGMPPTHLSQELPQSFAREHILSSSAPLGIDTIVEAFLKCFSRLNDAQRVHLFYSLSVCVAARSLWPRRNLIIARSARPRWLTRNFASAVISPKERPDSPW